MTKTNSIRSKINHQLDRVDDTMLAAIHLMLNAHLATHENDNYVVIGYELDGTPVTNQDLVHQLNDIDRRIEAGEDPTFSADEVMSEIWTCLETSK